MENDTLEIVLDDWFWDHVQKTDTCWQWIGTINKSGYGQLGYKNKSYFAHRFTYIYTYGKIPEGLELDHLCRNKSCVRPDHLEAVTHKENFIRALPFRKPFNNRKAINNHCIHGHEFTLSNTAYAPNGKTKLCRECHNARRRKTKITTI